MKRILSKLMSYLSIIAGALLASFSVACILLPNDAIDYGTAGIGIIISKLAGFDLSLCIFVVFIPFIILGKVLLGNSFFYRALVGSVAYTVGIDIFEKVPFELNTEHFIAVAFGGALLGVGLSIILKNGGCIDGSEIFANIAINRIFSKTGQDYSMSTILICFNACVYAAVFFLIDRNSALLSLLVYIVATVVIDKFTDHFEAIKQVTIITKTPDAIIKALKDELNKTCTIINAKGAIAGDNVVLICYINYFELGKIKNIIADNKGTFSTVASIDEIIR